MSQCPKCESEIGNSSYCGCGWKKPAPQSYSNEPPRVKCCHDDCFVTAFCKIQTPTGWANFCESHYTQYFRDQAKANCDAKGLKTTAEKRAWLQKMCETIGNRGKPSKPLTDDEIPF